jgi:hypothetical protein
MEHDSPEQTLGVDSNATYEQIEIAYHQRLGEIANALSRNLTDAASQADLEYERERIHRAYKSLIHSTHRSHSPMDAIISAELFPVLEPFEVPHNVVSFARRTGATAAQTEESAHAAAKPHLPETTPDAPQSDLEALLGMPRFVENRIRDEEDDESVLLPLGTLDVQKETLEVQKPTHRATNLPRRIRSVIGEHDKEVVGVRTPNSSSTGGKQKLYDILGQIREPNGALLIQMREALGVTAEELSSRTKILSRHIRALEHDDFNALPAPVYYRGFVDSYLRYLGIENMGLVNAFVQRYQKLRQTTPPIQSRG